MPILVLPDQFRAMLKSVQSSTEIYDHDGTFLGHFSPADSPNEKRLFMPPLTPEERKRIESESRYTCEEMMAHLRSL